jgi:geranylgeranyl pyrophosphate synthase
LNENAVPAARALLEKAGARTFAETEAAFYHERALAALHEALGERAADSAILVLAESLVGRTQ